MFVIAHWCIMAALKSLTGNSHICVISLLVSIGCPSLFKLRFSWFWYDKRFFIVYGTFGMLRCEVLDPIQP